MIVGSFPLQSGRLPLTDPSPAETGGGDAPGPLVRSFRPETMNVPRIPDFSRSALLWVTSVNNSGGWFWWNRKTWTNEDPKKQWHKLDHWFVGLISSKHQGNYEFRFISRLLLSIFSYRETFYFTPELNPSLLSRGWLMFDSMHN